MAANIQLGRKLKCISTLQVLFLSLSCFCGIESREILTKATSGVYLEELPPPILYESVVPIILEYTLPPWNKSEVTFNNWYNCTSEHAPYRYTCPIVYYMNQAVAQLHTDFVSLQPVRDEIPHTEFYSKLTTGADFCDQVQKHFSASFVQQAELNSYIQSLEKCQKADGAVHLERAIQDYSSPIRTPFTTIENRFYNTFYTRINAANLANGTLDLVASATLSNLRTTVQGLLLSHFYAEKNRWTHAIHDCRDQVIPHSIISEEKFQKTLNTVSKQNYFQNTSQLAIPVELMSKYYGLPLADCSFTNETFVVRILVPTNRKDSRAEALKLYKIRPVPFTVQGKICTIFQRDDTFLYDAERQMAFRTKCRPNELCRRAKGYEMGDHDTCATALISGKFNDTRRNCPFKCYTYEQARFLEDEGILSRVASDEYVISGHDGTAARLECPNKPANGLELVFMQEETLSVQMPCGCTIRQGTNRVYSSHDPCTVDLRVTRLLPWHLLKDPTDGQMDAGLIASFTETYTNPGFTWKAIMEADRRAKGAQVSPQEESSHAPLWVFFSLTTILLFLGQLYLIYELRQMRGSSGGSAQNWLYRARDPESEARLIDQRGHM